MSDINDGGPAFARPISHDGTDARAECFPSQEGMSLRDWFAGQAISGVLATDLARQTHLAGRYVLVDPERIRDVAVCYDGATTWDGCASYAYQIADAMLRARSKPSQ